MIASVNALLSLCHTSMWKCHLVDDCISSENAFISTWHQIFKDAEFGLLGVRVKCEILLSTAQSHYSGLLKFPGGISVLHSTYRFRVASLGTVINIPLEKAFYKAVWRLVCKQGISVISVSMFWVTAMSAYGHCNSIIYASHFQNRWPYSGQFPLFTIHLACTLDSRTFI